MQYSDGQLVCNGSQVVQNNAFPRWYFAAFQRGLKQISAKRTNSRLDGLRSLSNADPPADNELEISIFGPGYGESILLHVGAKEWAIIDSCLNETRQSAPLCYLESLGIEPASAVRVVVATHLHDDHIRGLSDIVRACTAAKFSCSLAFSKRDFFAMVTRYRKRNEIEGGSGVNEIFKIFKSLESRHQDPTYALANRPIFRFTGASALLGGECILTALSPSDAQLALFLKEIAALIPGSGTMRRAAPRTPNNVATVVWLSIGAEECVLLGSDLERDKRSPYWVVDS